MISQSHSKSGFFPVRPKKMVMRYSTMALCDVVVPKMNGKTSEQEKNFVKLKGRRGVVGTHLTLWNAKCCQALVLFLLQNTHTPPISIIWFSHLSGVRKIIIRIILSFYIVFVLCAILNSNFITKNNLILANSDNFQKKTSWTY